MPCFNLCGSCGSKAAIFRFSQPRGAVMTTSSNISFPFPSVSTTTLGPWSVSHESILVTLCPNLISAFRTGSAIFFNTFSYVPGTNRFSPSMHSSSQKNLRLWLWTGDPTNAPHISADSSMASRLRATSTSSLLAGNILSTSSSKKLYKLLLAGIVAL